MVLMGLPGKYFPTIVSFWDWLSTDKIVHLLLFAVFAFVSLWGYRHLFFNINYPHRKKLFLIISLISILYGGLTELLQKYLFINRYGSIYDFIADSIGCFIGILLFYFLVQKKLKNLKKSEDNI
jgi:VanZ family protein